MRRRPVGIDPREPADPRDRVGQQLVRPQARRAVRVRASGPAPTMSVRCLSCMMIDALLAVPIAPALWERDIDWHEEVTKPKCRHRRMSPDVYQPAPIRPEEAPVHRARSGNGRNVEADGTLPSRLFTTTWTPEEVLSEEQTGDCGRATM